MKKSVALGLLMGCLGSYALSAQLADVKSVAATYQALSALHGNQQRSLYRSLSAEMQGAVWKYQLETVASTEPQLSPQQHVVISDAIFLIDTGLFLAVNPDGSTALTQELANLEQQIRAEFSPDLAAAVFANLGPRAGRGRPPSQYYDVNCDCNILSDYCGSPTGTLFCNRLPRCNESSSGCGTLWRYACNGTCS